MFCSKCGNAVDNDAKFCGNCGNAITSESQEFKDASATNSRQVSKNQLGTKLIKIVKYALISILIFFGLAGIYFSIVNSNSTQINKSENSTSLDCEKMPPTSNYIDKSDRNACYDAILYSWIQVKNNLLSIDQTKEMVELMIENKMVDRCNADEAALKSQELDISPVKATLDYRNATEACMNSYK